MEYVAIRLIPISAADFIRVYYVSRSSILLLRSDPWYGRLCGDIKSPKSRDSRNVRKGEKGEGKGGGEEAFLETFWYTTKRGFYSLVARSQMGRRDIKTGCARVFVPQECGLHTFPLFTLYSRLFLLGKLLLPAPHPPPSPPFVAPYVFARMRSVSRDPILQNLHIARSVNLIRYHDRSLVHNNLILKQSSDCI